MKYPTPLETIRPILVVVLLTNVVLITTGFSSDLEKIIILINPSSGGNQGEALVKEFRKILPNNVFEVNKNHPPIHSLRQFSTLSDKRILVGGGDGTVDWVLFDLTKLVGKGKLPPVAILPLGTGNDLARTLRMGGGYTNGPICDILAGVYDNIEMLDRWIVIVTKQKPMKNSGSNVDCKLPLYPFNNYFSLGSDAEIALQFDQYRKAYPNVFQFQTLNKAAYAILGIDNLLLTRKYFSEFADIISKMKCNGRYIDQPLISTFATILFLNIPSYAGGTDPWTTMAGKFRQQRKDDGIIEVIGLQPHQMVTVNAMMGGTSIAQCRKLSFSTTKAYTVQLDGEPCILAPSRLQIKFNGKVPMVANSMNGPSNKMTRVINDCQRISANPPNGNDGTNLLNDYWNCLFNNCGILK